MMKTGGEPKPVASGKKGNVGGVATPGRHGHMLKGLNMLVKSGPATKKTANLGKIRPEGAVSIDAGNLKAASGTSKAAAGSPKSIKGGSVSAMSKIRPEGAIKRDAASVIKP